MGFDFVDLVVPFSVRLTCFSSERALGALFGAMTAELNVSEFEPQWYAIFLLCADQSIASLLLLDSEQGHKIGDNIGLKRA